MSAATAPALPPRFVLGRSLVNPLFDVALIGGGLSLLLPFALPWMRAEIGGDQALLTRLPLLFLLTSSCHFASSTVRLYTKPGAYQRWPFLTLGLPLVAIVLLALCLMQPERLGRHWQALYLTWSPFHYAAQAFGIASLYCVRSGCSLEPGEKRALRWICLMPFALAFCGGRASGVGWLLGAELIHTTRGLPQLLDSLQAILGAATMVAPLLFFASFPWRGRAPMPLLALLAVLANGVWFVVFEYFQAFLWATIFHGLQYLALVSVFHAREQVAQPDNHRSARAHVLRFYALCVGLTYLLFQVWPYGWWALGFGWAESVILVVATINLHHFVVDAFIWRFGAGEGNRRVALEGVPATAARSG